MSKRPNIVFFFTDDQRFSTIGAWGCEPVHTPNLDKLIGRGCSMRNAYIMGGSSGAVCMPSRAMLHTGRTLYHIEGQGARIADDHTMLGEHLRTHGYHTWGTGKWHNGAEAFNRAFADGAEIFFGGMNDHWNVPACDYHPDGDYPKAERLRVRFGQVLNHGNQRFDHIATGAHSTDLFADAAVDHLERYDRQDPYFMYLSFMAPHDPREMPPQYLSLYDPKQIELPPNFLPEHPFPTFKLGRDEMLAPYPRTEQDTRKQIAEYYAMISHVDDAVGRVIDAVERRGELDHTIFVLAGDNGLAVGQHGLFGKQSNYEHSIHVPLVFAGPGVPGGASRDGFAYLIDIFPTLCDLCGVDTPGTVEGQSLTGVMNDDASVRDHLVFAYIDSHRSVRDERFKLIETIHEDVKHVELFDLMDDPYEAKNLAAKPEYADDLARLRRLMRRWQSEWDDDRAGQGADYWAAYDALGG